MSDLPESLEQIEAMIASAKDYVAPSDHLRSRILDAARAQQSHWLGTWRLLQVAAVVFLCAVMSIPAQQRLDAWRSVALPPAKEQIESRAQQFAIQPTIGPNWSLYEAYKSLRQDQQLIFGVRQR